MSRVKFWPRGAITGFIFLVSLASAHAQTATYSQSAEFSSVRLSYADLSDVVTRVHGLVAQANAAVKCERARETVSVGDGSSGLELTGDFSPTSFASAPPIAYSVSYSYTCYDAPISRVELSLADFRRQVSVSGQSRDQVVAVSAIVSQIVKGYESGFGGFGFRGLGAVLLVLVGSIIPFLGALSPHRAVKVVFWIAGPMVSLSIWVFPWDRWFPGAAFYSRDAAFLVRHSALISFLGAVVTVLTFAISIWYSRRLALTGAQSPQPSQSPQASASRRRRR